MSTVMLVTLVADRQLETLRNNPDAVAELSETAEVEDFGPNHRNVNIFHYILNGKQSVAGSPLGIFESWLNPASFTSYQLTEEAFGMPSLDVAKLSAALHELSESKIQERWSQWRKENGIVKPDDEPAFFPESFSRLAQIGERAVSEKKGLVWLAG